VVIGSEAAQIRGHFKGGDSAGINWVLQAERLGTGHAVQQALPDVDTGDERNWVMVLYGDVPLIKSLTLNGLLEQMDLETVALLTVRTENPSGLGRVIRDEAGRVAAIVEEKDATEEQKQIKEVNSGIMCIPAKKLEKWLGKVSNNNQQSEYYLTDIIGFAVSEGCQIKATTHPDEIEVQGVNDKAQLALLEKCYQMKKQQELMDAGVTLRDPSRVDIRGTVKCGKDCVIDVNVIFEDTVTLGDNVEIGANTVIRAATLGDGVQILPGTNIDGATIGRDSVVGPYARIRPGTTLDEGVKIGNFVEIKGSKIGAGSKANHLAYIGDAEIGQGCNIGAGTIFCNYDGANKHKSVLGNNVFIGSNCVLVAPIRLEDEAFVAAGSAINNDVPAGNLAVGRAKQRNIARWKRPAKLRKSS
jgi:bifunctional UDP-N-acetylglucosamine pyrophosphorylase/glucosamine-1-phosphate N-acetyltransferase